MKPKTGFESGSSPTKISGSGAPVLTGRGLRSVQQQIVEAFSKIRQHPAHPAQHAAGQDEEPPLAQQTPPLQPQVYTEKHKTRFHERAKSLSLAALSSSHIMKATRCHVFEIAVPTESAEELIAEALGE